MKEIRGRIYLFHILPLGFLHHWRKLPRITYHQKLNAAERLVTAAIPAQSHVNRIQKIGTDH